MKGVIVALLISLSLWSLALAAYHLIFHPCYVTGLALAFAILFALPVVRIFRRDGVFA